MSHLKISYIEKNKIDPFINYIPSDEIAGIRSGNTQLIGVISEENKPVGALVADIGTEPDGGKKAILGILHMHLVEDYRDEESVRSVLDAITSLLEGKKIYGIAIRTLDPDAAYLESLLEERYERLEDGNVIYEVPTERFSKHPIVRREYDEAGGRIIRISDLDLNEKTELNAGWTNHFPAGLAFDNMPGRLLPELSYVIRKQDEYIGVVLTSELGPDKIYVGSIYVRDHDGLTVAALLGQLGRDVLTKSQYKTLMFTAASDEGKKLCEHLTEGIGKVTKRTIRFYYLEV